MFRFASLVFWMGACASTQQDPAAVLLTEATNEELSVAYVTNDRLLSAQVPTMLHPGESDEILVDFEWSTAPPDVVEFTLWKAGGSSPIRHERFGLSQAHPNERQRAVWVLELEETFEEGPYWVMVRLRSDDEVVEADMAGLWELPAGAG